MMVIDDVFLPCDAVKGGGGAVSLSHLIAAGEAVCVFLDFKENVLLCEMDTNTKMRLVQV